MNYVFFDTECANCLKGEGKICSFGYVLTDEAFQVLKKKDILINPDAPFLLGNARKGEGIELAYPLSRFRNSHRFPYYYDAIRHILEEEDVLVVGFCIHQDIAFLDYTCHRYGLSLPSFSYVDLQKLDKRLYQTKDYRGLDTLIEQFGLAKFTYHRSDDDAMMTMEVFSKILDENHLGIEDVRRDHQEACGTSLELAERLRQRRREKAKKRQLSQKAARLFAQKAVPSLSYYNPFFWNKKVFFKTSSLYRHLDYLTKNAERFLLRGMTFVENPAQADIIVYDRGDQLDRIRQQNEKAVFLLFPHFQKKVENG